LQPRHDGEGRWNDKNLSHFFAIYSSGLSAVVVVVVKGEIRAKLQMNAMNVASDGGFFASCHSLYEQSFRARYTEKKNLFAALLKSGDEPTTMSG
jgi:hypothetical protein